MYKIEGYWNIVPQIKNVSFPSRGKMQVDLEDGRSILVDVSKFPNIKKLSLKDRQNWYKTDNGFSFEKCSEVIHIEQILGNFQNYRHEGDTDLETDNKTGKEKDFSSIKKEFPYIKIERRGGFDDEVIFSLGLKPSVLEIDLPISIKSLPNNEGYIIVDRYDTEYHFKYENGQLVYDRAEYKE